VVQPFWLPPDFGGFLAADAEVLIEGRLAKLRRADHVLFPAHQFTFAGRPG
jgi:hypothetical protein